MSFKIVTGPDGKPTVQLDKPVYKGPETAVPPSPNPLGEAITGAGKALTQISESIPSVVPGLSAGNIKAGVGALYAGAQELGRSKDPYKALQVTGQAIKTEIEKPQNVGQKVIYSGARDLAQSALVNLPQSASRKPGQADSPIPGYGKPFPSFKLNPAEQVASTLVQGALAILLTRRVVSPLSGSVLAIPRVASVAQKIQAGATALKATGTVGRTAVGIAKVSSEGAVVGSIAEGVGFTPGKDPSLVEITKVLDKLAGTSLHQPLKEFIVSKGGSNSDVEARFVNAASDFAVIGPAFANTIAAAGFFLRAAFRKAARTATPSSPPPPGPGGPGKPAPSKGSAATPSAAPPVTTAADQALNDFQAARRQETQTKKDALGGKPDPRVDPKAARRWQTRSNKYERELKIIEQQEIAEQNARLKEKTTNFPSTKNIDDPWLDDVDVDGDVTFYGKQLDDALTEAAKGPQPPASSVAGVEPRIAVMPVGNTNMAAAAIEPPKGQVTTRSLAPVSNLSQAKTGQPLEFLGYRGEGKPKEEIYRPGSAAVPAAGKGRYVAIAENDAKFYGDKINNEEVRLQNPLVIRTDAEWVALTREAGWKFPNLTFSPEAEVKKATEALRKLVSEQKGHDGLVIDPSMRGDDAKTLDDVFSHPQIVDYKPRVDAPTSAAVDPTSLDPRVELVRNLEAVDEGVPPGGGNQPPTPGGPNPPEGPRPSEGPRPPDEDEAQRIARLTEENRQALINGDITQEDIYKLNTYQRSVSRSGNTFYTTKAEELSPLLAAMSEVKGGTEVRTGLESFTLEEVAKINQDWINTYGLDWDLNYSSFAALDKGMKSYELGSLNRAMTMLDEAHVIAGKEAGMWLNNIGMDDATALERLNNLVTALGTVTERSVVIDRIRRRWGQLGKEMQMPRNYDIPDQPTGVVQAAIKEETENFNATTPAKLNIDDPQLQGILDGSVEMSEEAMAKIDDIAQTMADVSVGPKKARMQFYTDVSDGGGGGGGKMVPFADAFRMYYTNSLISGPDTVRVNLYNAMFNYSYLVTSQILGNFAHLDFERALYSGNMFIDAFARIPKAFELAGHAGKLGKSLFSERNIYDDGLGKTTVEIQSIADARQAAVEIQDDSLVNKLPEELTGSSYGKLVNHLWKALGTPFTRASIAADTFSSSIAGYSYERMLHMSRGMDLAVENGLTRMSPEAWKSATAYSVARSNLSMKDAVVNGKTIADALLESPHAQKFIDAVNFSDDVAVQLEPRSPVEGYRVGKAKKLEGEELDKFVEDYLAGGTGVRPIAEQMMTGKIPLGTVASIPGKIFEKAYTEPLFPNVPGTLPYQKFAMTLVQSMYKVPLNIVKSAMRSLPGPNFFVDSYWRDITSADVNTQRRAEGQILTATGALTMLYATAAGGYVRFNGNGPSNLLLKKAWLDDRQMPNSMQVWNPTTGTWFPPIPLNAFGPLNISLGIMADYLDMADRATPAQQDRMDALLSFELLRLSAFNVINVQYFNGILNIYNAIFDTTELSKYGNDQNGAYRWLQKTLPNLLPNSRTLKAIAKEIDPVLRRVNPAQPEEGFMGPARELNDNLRMMTPGYSKTLPPQLNWSLPGAPPILLPQYAGQGLIPQDAPWLSAALVFSPLTIGKVGREITDPVQKELNLLYNSGGIPNKVFNGPRAGDFGEGVFLDPVDFAAYVKLFASIKNPDTQKTWHQTVSEMIKTPSYLSLPIEIPASNDVAVRAVLIQSEIEKFKTLAKAEFGRNNFKIQNAIRAKQERTRDAEFVQEYGTPGQPPSKSAGLPQFTEALR